MSANAENTSPGQSQSRRNLRAQQAAAVQAQANATAIPRTGSAGNLNNASRGSTPPRANSTTPPPKSSQKNFPGQRSVDAPAAPTAKNYKLMFHTGLLLVSAVGNSVFYKKMISKFSNYPYFLTQWTTFVYLPVFWFFTGYQYFFVPGSITPEMLKFPLYKFFVMGCMDSLSGVFGLLGAVHTSGQFQSLLNQIVIPITMILAYVIIGERYKKTQYIGAGIIIIGVLVAIVPQYTQESSSGQSDNKLVFNMLYMLSSAPAAFSGVYKEIAFTVDMEVNYLQAWVATWQMVFGFVLAPINALPFLGDSYIAISDMPAAVANGFKCMIGIDTYTLPNCALDPTDATAALKLCDTCPGAWVPLVVYLAFNMCLNIALVQVTKYGGANVCNFVGTLTLPLVQLSFSLSFINNPPEKFHWYLLVALFCIILGLIIYRYKRADAPADEKPGRDFDVGFFQGGRLVHVTEHFENRQNPQRIRSAFYARLGIKNHQLLSKRASRTVRINLEQQLVKNGSILFPLTVIRLANPLHCFEIPHNAEIKSTGFQFSSSNRYSRVVLERYL